MQMVRPNNQPVRARGAMKVGFHTGNIINYLAEKYRRADQVIAELVQNQIDACDDQIGGGKSLIVLDLAKNILQAWDNGTGASREAMTERVAKIGAKMKSAKQIGEKGIGNLAGIALGGRYRMITRSRDQKPRQSFFELILDRDAVDDQEEVSFHWEEREPGFNFSGEQSGMSTYIDIRAIPSAALAMYRRFDNPAEEIASGIANAFSSKILELGLQIEIRVAKENKSIVSSIVRPLEFPGRQEVVFLDTPAGKVTFSIYLTHSQGKNPIVQVDHEGKFSFPLKNLDIWPEISDFFGCGHVQGRIRVDFCSLAGD